jgi:hypothetical protein
VASDVGATSQPSMIGKRVLAVLHPGAEVGWLHTGRSEATSRRAAQAGLTPFDDLAGAAGPQRTLCSRFVRRTVRS